MKKIVFIVIIIILFILFLYGLYNLYNRYNKYPLISAICVTRKRTSHLKRAIECFNYQTYPNRELVVVYDSDDEETHQFLSNNNNNKTVKVVNSSSLKLGGLRNLGINQANGKYVVQFDDDDEYSPDRLMTQYNEIVKQGGEKACLLSRWYIFDEITKKQYLSPERTWEGSIMAPKSLLMKYPYPEQSKGEDTVVINQLLQSDQMFMIDRPELYVYHLHFTNTWERSHGLSLIRDCKELEERLWWQ